MKRLFALTSLLLLTAAHAQQARELRLGVFPNVTHAAGLVGIQKGFFQKELGNTKLVVKEFANGSQINEAFARGEIDAAYVGPGPAMSGFLKGLPIQIYAGAANAGAVLVASEDSGIRNVKQLAGKRVAVPTRGSTQEITLWQMMKPVGLKPTEKGGNVTITPINPAAMLAAFSSGKVDAAIVQEPWGTLLEVQGAKLVTNSDGRWVDGNATTTVLVVSTKFAQANPEALKDLLKGHLNSVRFIASSSAGTQKALADQIATMTGVKPDTAQLFKALNRTKITWDINESALADYAESNVESGYATTVPDFKKLLNLGLIHTLAQ